MKKIIVVVALLADLCSCLFASEDPKLVGTWESLTDPTEKMTMITFKKDSSLDTQTCEYIITGNTLVLLGEREPERNEIVYCFGSAV